MYTENTVIKYWPTQVNGEYCKWKKFIFSSDDMTTFRLISWYADGRRMRDRYVKNSFLEGECIEYD